MSRAVPSEPLEAGLELATALEARGVPYALGGALAYGLWGIPRATVDVDVNVFVADDALGPVVDGLADLGVQLDLDRARRDSENAGLIVTQYGPFRVDLFTPSIAFSWEAMRTRVRYTIEGRAAWFLSAEAVAVFKLLFFRGKDIVDLQRLIAVQGRRLDASYVRAQIVDMMGDDDERVRRWDALVATHMA